MARPPRPLLAGGTYHVFTRGVDRGLIHRDADDAEALLELLARVIRTRAWSCRAFCLMPNHVHLLVTTPEPDLASGMQDALGRYGRRFNDRHGRVGPVFAGRYGSRLVTSDAHDVWLLRYIARNPVGAGLCAAPAEWRWSSHADVLGRDRWSFVDTAAAVRTVGSLAAYRQLVDDPTPHAADGPESLALDPSPAMLAFHQDLHGSSRRALSHRSGLSEHEVRRRLKLFRRTHPEGV